MRCPVVSVVIPVYNRARVLPRALDSVLAQTHQDFEILVVDDGSTDAVATVVDGYRSARIRLIRLGGRFGAARARNVGIREARGEWVAFLDSDDEWLPPKLETQLARVRSADRQVALVYGLRLITDHRGNQTWSHRESLHEGAVFDALLRGGWTPPPSVVMVRRSALMTVGGFDETLPSFQDYDLWLRLAQVDYRFAAVDAVLAVKHRHEGPQIGRDPRARIRGLRAMDSKWGRVLRERLGPDAYRAWWEGRFTALPSAQLAEVRAAVAAGDRVRAWQLCRAMWHGPASVRVRFGGRAVALAILGWRGYGLLVRLRRVLIG